MGFLDISEDPSNRQMLVVLDKKKFKRLKNQGEDRLKSQEYGFIVRDELTETVDNINLREEVIIPLKQQGLLSVDDILVQNPYKPNQYRPIENAKADFVLAKHNKFASLCQKLGAKKVGITISNREKLKQSLKAEINASRAAQEGSIDFELEMIEKLSRKIELKHTFQGSNDLKLGPAEAFLKNHALSQEPTFSHLLELRKAENNEIKEYCLKVEMAREANQKLKVAAKANLAEIVSLDMEMEWDKVHKTDYTMEYKVKF